MNPKGKLLNGCSLEGTGNSCLTGCSLLYISSRGCLTFSTDGVYIVCTSSGLQIAIKKARDFVKLFTITIV